MWAILAEAYGWSHEAIMMMTPRQTRAYFAQVPALRAAEQQRWLVTFTAALSQSPEAIRHLSDELDDIMKGKKKKTATQASLITTDPIVIRAFLDGAVTMGKRR